ncbi:hypothetical protein T265_12119 [Opisthorchis viverrini]|uniref:Uncharacterized protein n=1 Tax=Opisthorchis viverrini TaxID=6198 RepID=A0A074Z072_OPIVI|nr:hypothetical protein T265_12119 [Opisthorchis viverrini]KER18872.1 hypothetical protein T265_12119 [Opisthorchis viverrini]
MLHRNVQSRFEICPQNFLNQLFKVHPGSAALSNLHISAVSSRLDSSSAPELPCGGTVRIHRNGFAAARLFICLQQNRLEKILLGGIGRAFEITLNLHAATRQREGSQQSFVPSFIVFSAMIPDHPGY